MTDYLERAGLEVAAELVAFVETEALAGLPVQPAAFWEGFARAVSVFGPQIRAALARRETLQEQIDAFFIADPRADTAQTLPFLRRIGYLEPEPTDFALQTEGCDAEIARICGPQLVVPITNARYALNAANARFGSLYDALYGTDALGDLPAAKGYDTARGGRVIGWAKTFLDETFPLVSGSWGLAHGLRVEGGLFLDTDETTGLADPSAFVGYAGAPEAPSEIVLKNNGLHVVLKLDPRAEIGSADPAGICDIALEAAVSAIMDLEDSVACVDAQDKVLAYRNWLGLMRGDLIEQVEKAGKTFTRALAADRAYLSPEGAPFTLKGRALMLVRNVGHLMTTPAIRAQGEEISEGLMDAFLTTLCALHDRAKPETALKNSETGAIYIVKPKMHGPAEVALSCAIFGAVEAVLGLPHATIKLGIMDEERRTSANLKACIHAARDRCAFINTGFLDRTGDEIHSAMEAGIMARKGEMKALPWIAAYEARNVEIGLACGLAGRAQIGKGMWAAPDRMAEMLAQKSAHPAAGANCAWVPSPTAAVLHATHYHRIDVRAVQAGLAASAAPDRLAALLTLPRAERSYSPEEITQEIENNAQGILGYVVRWVDQGVGCSKVPDIHNVGLMEDRATCRISAQALANWLHHGVISQPQMMGVLRKMALVVDQQNADDPAYQPMGPSYSGLAFQAACDLVFMGRAQPSGYTEPLLHKRRAEVKGAKS